MEDHNMRCSGCGRTFKTPRDYATRKCVRCRVDVEMENHGSVWLFRPVSEVGHEWVKEHVFEPMWFEGAIAVEHRYAYDLSRGMREDQLVVEMTG